MAGTVFIDGYYETRITRLSNTTETTCYTVPTGKWAYIQQIHAAETAGGARTITVKATKSGTDYVVVYGGAIPVNDALDMDLKPLTLVAGETIKCTASAATVDVFISVLEVAQPRM